MRCLKSLFGMISLALLLNGCAGVSLVGKLDELVKKGENKAVPALAETVTYRCQKMSQSDRLNLFNGVNGELLKRNLPHKVMALDCDGDGRSDF